MRTEPVELRMCDAKLDEVNVQRKHDGMSALPTDDELDAALAKAGITTCFGKAYRSAS